MNIDSLELTEQQQYHLDTGWKSEVDICVDHRTFPAEYLEAHEMELIDDVIEEFKASQKDGLTWTNEPYLELIVIKSTDFTQMFAYKVVSVRPIRFIRWHAECLLYICFAAKLAKRIDTEEILSKTE